MHYLNTASRAARMFPHLPISRFIISFNDFDIRLVSRERKSWLVYKLFSLICSGCTEILLFPYFFLPISLQRMMTHLSCSVAVNYSAIGIYRLTLFYPIYAAVLTAVAVCVLLVLATTLCCSMKLTPTPSYHQRYSYQGNDMLQDEQVAQDLGLMGEGGRVSWTRYFFGTFFQSFAVENSIGKSSFTELQQDGEMKLDGPSTAASLRAWKSRHQLEAVPEQSENASEDEAAVAMADYKVDASEGFEFVPNHPNQSKKRKKSVTDFIASPPARKSVRQRSKLRRKRPDETDNDSYGPGASVNSIDEDFVTIESNHSSAEKPANVTIMSDMTPVDHGPLKGPGSAMYHVREDKSTAHPMWR